MKKILASSLLTAYCLLLITPVSAQVTLPQSPASNFPQTSADMLPTSIINIFLPSILILAGFMAAVFIVISGIQFITSSGDPKGADAARQRLIYAVVGFIVVIMAFAALQLINKMFLGTTLS